MVRVEKRDDEEGEVNRRSKGSCTSHEQRGEEIINSVVCLSVCWRR